MNLREKIEKEITEKVMTKLASERVELANVQMIESIVADGKDIYKKAQKFESEISSFTKKASLYFNNAKSLELGGEKILKDFEKAAKDLGLSANNLPQYKEAKEVLGVMNSVKSRLEQFSKLK